MLQTALAAVRNAHDVVRAFVAGEFDHVDQRLFIIALGGEGRLDPVGDSGVVREPLHGQAHRETEPLADHGALKKNTVAVGADLSGDELKRQPLQLVGIVAALIGEAGDRSEHLLADAGFSGLKSFHVRISFFLMGGYTSIYHFATVLTINFEGKKEISFCRGEEADTLSIFLRVL